jgi:hypothetical protein
MQTPWGKTTYINKHQCGVTWTSTPSHEGYRISKGFAKKFLSEPAQKRGFEWGNYKWYEGDVDSLIIEFELVFVRTKLQQDNLLQSLSYWHRDYLTERGITPVETNRYLAQPKFSLAGE